MTKEELTKLYTEEGKSFAEIARLKGMTRQGVHYFANKYRIEKRVDEKKIIFSCHMCGKKSIMFKSKYDLNDEHFCSMKCYRDYQKSDEFYQNVVVKRMKKNREAEK